jgi:hypothetical protein
LNQISRYFVKLCKSLLEIAIRFFRFCNLGVLRPTGSRPHVSCAVSTSIHLLVAILVLYAVYAVLYMYWEDRYHYDDSTYMVRSLLIIIYIKNLPVVPNGSRIIYISDISGPSGCSYMKLIPIHGNFNRVLCSHLTTRLNLNIPYCISHSNIRVAESTHTSQHGWGQGRSPHRNI